jgi:histone acetyltransferase MYST1
VAEGGGEARLTRRQRRKTGDGEMILSSAVESSADNSQSEEHFAMDVVTTLTAPTLDEHEGMDEAALKEHEEVTKVKNVATLELGEYQMNTWYFSPLPKELLPGGMIDVLYVDEFSLNFFTRKIELQRYQERELPRGRRHPPGNEIYRCGNLSMFEVDGYEQRIYCQNLCYIAKLFLDHKTLYYDVDPFLFYVLCEVDERGEHMIFLAAIQILVAQIIIYSMIITIPNSRLPSGRLLLEREILRCRVQSCMYPYFPGPSKKRLWQIPHRLLLRAK